MKASPIIRRLLFASALLASANPAHAQLYWDTNGTTGGFGTASGTWGSDAFWNNDATGGAGTFSPLTTTSDSINFGNGTTGLAAGMVAVDGAVDSGNMTFASGSGAITLSGGTINLAAASTIAVDNATNTLASAISGAATSLTKAGTGTLVLRGGGTMAGNLVIAGGTGQLGADNGISTSAGIDIYGGAAASRILDLNGYDQTLSRFGFSAVNSDGNLTITGGANSTLTINATGNSLLGQSGTSTNPITPARTFLTDMSGLGEFVWDGGSDYYFEVGPRGSNPGGGENNPGTATVVLAGENTITGTQIRVGANGMNNHGGTSTLRLGQTNILNANTINIGASARSNATLDFRDGLGGTPTVTLRGTDGSSAVTTWDVGRVAAVNSPTTWTSTVDLSAGEIDALVTSLRIGRADTANATNRGGILNASFTMGEGTLEVNTLLIGQYAGGGSLARAYAGNGTFTLDDATGLVKADTIILADNTGTATNGATRASTSGTFNLTAGTLEAISIDKGANTGNAVAANVTRNFNFTSGTIRNLAGNNLTIANVPLNLTGSGTRIFEATAGQSITVAATSVISGVGQGFTKIGDGTLALSGANTYTGGTTISAGTVSFDSTAAPGTGALVFDNGGTSSSTAVFSVAATHANPITVAAGSTGANTIRTTNGTGTVKLDGAVTLNAGTTLTLDNSGSALDVGTGVIAGDGNLEATGTSTGNFIFRGDNTYSGGTLLSGSGIYVPALSSTGPDGSPTSGPFGTGTLTIDGATMRSTNLSDTTIGNTMVLEGNLTAINVSSEKNLTFTGPVTLTGTRTIDSSVGQTVAGKSLIFSGAIGDGGNGYDLIKEGGGTLTLSGTNTYTGATHVNDGTLQISSTGALGGTSALHLGTTTGTTLRVNVNGLAVNAPIHTADAGQTSTILGVFNSGDNAIPVVTTLNAITGAGDLLLSNSAPLPGNIRFNFILNAAGDHTGTTTIASQGDHNTNVILGVANGLSTATVLTFANSGGVGSGRQMNFDLNGFDQVLSGLQSTGANLRAIRVHNTSETAATLTINDDGDRTFKGALGTTGTSDTTTGNNFGIVKNGTGTWNLQLSNLSALANSYSGGTILNQGGITLGNGSTLGSGSLQVNNSNTGAGTNVLLTLASGSDLTVGSLSGTLATPASGTNTADIATQGGRTFTVNQTADGTFDGVISGAGDFALGADSTHSLTLSAENTYSGATTVSAGTLYITGALSNSAVTVGVNGAIGRNDNTPGGGSLGNGLTIEEGGQLDLTGAMLGLNSSGILSLTGGSLTLGALTFQDLHGWDWFNATPGTYQLIDGGFSVDFGDTPYVSEATAYDFGNGKSGYFTSGSLNAVIIPEPGATALLGGLGLLALLRRRR